MCVRGGVSDASCVKGGAFGDCVINAGQTERVCVLTTAIWGKTASTNRTISKSRSLSDTFSVGSSGFLSPGSFFFFGSCFKLPSNLPMDAVDSWATANRAVFKSFDSLSAAGVRDCTERQAVHPMHQPSLHVMKYNHPHPVPRCHCDSMLPNNRVCACVQFTYNYIITLHISCIFLCVLSLDSKTYLFFDSQNRLLT